MTVEAQKTRDPDHMQAVYLEKLADELSHRGLEAWLMAPPGRKPSLYVVNPAARALEENVYAGCARSADPIPGAVCHRVAHRRPGQNRRGQPGDQRDRHARRRAGLRGGGG